MDRPPRVVVVTTEWGDEHDERHLVLRHIAAALALGTVDPVVLRLGRDSPPRVDGAFEVVGVESTLPDPRRTRLLEAALDPDHEDLGTRAPEMVQRELSRLAGGVTDELASRISALDPGVVIFAGYRSAAIESAATALQGTCPCVLAPLAGSDPLLSLPTFDGAFTAVDTAVTVTPAEQDLVVARRGGASNPRFVGFSLGVDRLARETEPPGLNVEDFILVLARTSGRAGRRLELLGRYVHDQLPHVPMVIVGNEHMLVSDLGGWEERPALHTRMDLWRVLSRALVTVDLCQRGLLARDVLESLIVGTPVVVRSHGSGRDHAQRADGGLWWRNPRELVECVRALQDPSIRARLGDRGRAYAEGHYGDLDAFVQRVREVA